MEKNLIGETMDCLKVLYLNSSGETEKNIEILRISDGEVGHGLGLRVSHTRLCMCRKCHFFVCCCQFCPMRVLLSEPDNNEEVIQKCFIRRMTKINFQIYFELRTVRRLMNRKI